MYRRVCQETKDERLGGSASDSLSAALIRMNHVCLRSLRADRLDARLLHKKSIWMLPMERPSASIFRMCFCVVW